LGTPPKISARNLEQQEAARNQKRFVFSLGPKQIAFYAAGLLLAMCWMFIFGILVGRGLPMISSQDVSVRAEFMRFLGLDRPPPSTAEKAAETWQAPEKMLESLKYYEELTRKEVSTQAKTAVPPGAPSTSPAAKDAAADARNKPTKSLPVPLSTPDKPESSDSEKTSSGAAGQEPVAANNASEHFTLLVASLKDADNAQKLVEQLRAKGYAPRLHTLDLNGGGRWNRVLVGSFRSRESALKFAADFNKKERMEGLVIRESN